MRGVPRRRTMPAIPKTTMMPAGDGKVIGHGMHPAGRVGQVLSHPEQQHVAMTANWPAMTRKVWPSSRRLSSASTWSGVKFALPGEAGDSPCCVSLRSAWTSQADHFYCRFNHIRGRSCQSESPRRQAEIHCTGRRLFHRKDEQAGFFRPLAGRRYEELVPLRNIQAGPGPGGGGHLCP